MKKILLCLCLGAFLHSCNYGDKKSTLIDSETKIDLPYTASYSSHFTADVSDADLKTVLQTYKDWETGNMKGLESNLADSVSVINNSGNRLQGTKAEIMKVWTTYRDSLSSISIDMQGWHKMYSTDKKDGYIVTWYKEYDTYKTGKVDSAYFHDINQMKNGKIIWFSQYKRPAK